MIALDTNVLVRVLVQDDPKQTPIAQELLETKIAEGENLFVADPVLCEIEWVLASCYGIPRDRLLAMVQELAANPHFVFEDRGVLQVALDAFSTGTGDLSDYLIHGKAMARESKATYTFDRALQNTEGVVVLK